MTKHEKQLLIKQAAKLTTLGVTVERERGKLKKTGTAGRTVHRLADADRAGTLSASR